MKVLGLVFFVIASIIGAGFASGKEIATYFCRFGFLAIPSIFMTGVVLFVLIKHCLMIGKNSDNFHIAKGYKVLLYSTLLFLGGSMLAGNELLGSMLKIPCINLITLVVSGLFVHIGMKSIKRLNFVVSPIIYTCIIVLVISGLSHVGTSVNIPIQNTPIISLINVAGYISFNFLLVAMYLIQIGKNYTDREIKLASVLSSVFIVVLILIIAFVIMFSKTDIYSSEMPLITFAFSISKVLGYAMLIVVWFGLLTSLLSCLNSMLMLSKSVIKKPLTNLLANLALIFLISRLGFSIIVRYVYLVAGLVGLIFVYKIIKYKCIEIK